MGLKSAIVGDLIVDYRQALELGQTNYAEKCLKEIQLIFKNRRKLKFDHWGYPIF